MDAIFEVAVQILLVAAVVRFSDNFSSAHAFKVRDVKEVTRFRKEGFDPFCHQNRFSDSDDPVSTIACSGLVEKFRKVLATQL